MPGRNTPTARRNEEHHGKARATVKKPRERETLFFTLLRRHAPDIRAEVSPPGNDAAARATKALFMPSGAGSLVALTHPYAPGSRWS